ncbi:helix-turn-helix domain-containing protein [Arsenicicoccus cauae]|uniref:helix-turn-helix domain-containing protein n=1 Tax=Arsenicicoccus cauae TaxID=2663847 RepID=UPI00370D5F96
MTLGERLRRARLAAGMTQAGLADARFSVSDISHLESGRRPHAAATLDGPSCTCQPGRHAARPAGAPRSGGPGPPDVGL